MAILDSVAPTFWTVRHPMPGAEWLDRVRRYLGSAHTLAQLTRFALVGGFSNIAYVLLFVAMTQSGPLVANIIGSIVSTMIANELHRQLTFRAAGRVGWFTAQWEGGGLALLGLLISTAALAGLEFWAPGIGEITQAAAVVGVMAVVGGLRFLALRGFVFRNACRETSPTCPAPAPKDRLHPHYSVLLPTGSRRRCSPRAPEPTQSQQLRQDLTCGPRQQLRLGDATHVPPGRRNGDRPRARGRRSRRPTTRQHQGHRPDPLHRRT
ncbi:GtrA family protein [Nocardia wallacei]|uniref:GtrA family protein n=1 Tax=Nocardia wallacei TaxID=480035 RepID=UPI0016573C2C